MTILTATNTAELLTALSQAQGGDTIELATGTYSSVALNNMNFTSPVSIISEDSNHPASITGMTLNKCSDINFENLDFSFAAATSNAGTGAFGIVLQTCSNIQFVSNNIHGVLGVAPDLDIKGIHVVASSFISMLGNEIQFLRVGIGNENSSNVTITGNNFHDLRVDGVDTFGTSFITISDNNFSNFHRLGTPPTGGDHGDAMQFWTAGTTTGAHDITIANNVIVQGAGEVFEGVFMTDAASVGYQNVTISDNLIVGGAWNGIYASDVTNLQLHDNTLVGIGNQTPWIKIENSNSVDLENNAAMKFTLNSDTNVTDVNSTITQAVTDQGLDLITYWLSNHDHPMLIGLATPEQLISGLV